MSEIRCLGLEDYIDDQLLIEWADRSAELMPCDLSVAITHTEIDGRQLHMKAKVSLNRRSAFFAAEVGWCQMNAGQDNRSLNQYALLAIVPYFSNNPI